MHVGSLFVRPVNTIFLRLSSEMKPTLQSPEVSRFECAPKPALALRRRYSPDAPEIHEDLVVVSYRGVIEHRVDRCLDLVL